MTIKELIKYLKEYNPKFEVIVNDLDKGIMEIIDMNLSDCGQEDEQVLILHVG